MNRTRIVATIGPATCSEEALKRLAEAGMTIARLNGAQATLDWHRATIALIRKAVPQVAILLDLPGRKVRTVDVKTPLTFAVGDRVVFTTDRAKPAEGRIPVDHPKLTEQVQVGGMIMGNDGLFRFKVEAIEGSDIVCRAETAGIMGDRKGINIPGVTLGAAPLRAHDLDLVALAAETGVDFLGLSFVESAGDVAQVRAKVGSVFPRLVAKVETRAALADLDDIAIVADGLMIDRGDLSIEVNLEEIALLQKKIIAAGKRMGKPTIVATEMMHSMAENPMPVKAEIADITNAVLDGAAAVMLSGETAIGRYPDEAVRTMRRVCSAAEGFLVDGHVPPRAKAERVPQAIQQAIALICRSLPVTKIVAVTRSGFAARQLSMQGLDQPIIAVSDDARAARCFALYAGVEGVYLDIPFQKTGTDHVAKCLEALWRQGRLVDEDLVVVTAVTYPRSGNRMNLIQTHLMSDLRESLGWE
ncbi:pyruvate kinase [Paramagnetospirillum marisnigri]|uniref:Pyruvate kinase n=1 Tax=Paramagnetospirillum marisnigri TaxID=1285242 RepID=A0A178MAP7_9PROT|nr:pyruvate kinase [Paramagnetospirillum marisnigri]OAN45606.1 pyruvate kinase [Paramagnetospirillum marisnigri]